VAFAGPAMNLCLAIVGANVWAFGLSSNVDALIGPGQSTFFFYFVFINLMLFMFNLLPIGPLDGHYIAEYLLPSPWNYRYHVWNGQYGSYVLLALIVVSILGFPMFRMLANFSQSLIPLITFL
jgi:Zn-dependent protease